MAAITSAAIGVAVAGASTYMSVQQKKKAQKEMEGYQRQDIAPGTSPYENVQISTVGSELMREENQRATSNAFDVLGLSGDRAIVGGVGKVVAGNNALNREAQQYLDQQDIKRQYAIAGDETALRSMREERDNANIAAISSQIAAGEQGIQDGVMGMASGVAAMGRAYGMNKTNSMLEASAKKGGPITSSSANTPQSLPQVNNTGATFPQQQSAYQSPFNFSENAGSWQNPFSYYNNNQMFPAWSR